MALLSVKLKRDAFSHGAATDSSTRATSYAEYFSPRASWRAYCRIDADASRVLL